MNKTDIGKVLSLSCVENYFLGYFQNKFDVRLLYTESFVPFNDVIESFLNGEVSYENYPLPRLQDVSEKLGLTSHTLKTEICTEKNQLSLIRVNKEFFRNSKLLPWRTDHYIMLDKAMDEYTFLNNYPLSDGKLNKDELEAIYDGACLLYRTENRFDIEKYEELRKLQYERIAKEAIKDVQISEGKIVLLRDAALLLKTLRSRLIKWMQYEGEKGRFDDDLSFQLLSDKLIKQYNELNVMIQLQLARKRTDIHVLNEKLSQLCERERVWNREIKIRRG